MPPSSTDITKSKIESNLDVSVNVEYCKATPESKEWHAYQLQRVLAIKELKMRNLKLEKQAAAGETTQATQANAEKVNQHIDPITTTKPPVCHSQETSRIPAILKKVTKRYFQSSSKDTTSNVTWKEPLADMKFLPTGWMKVPEIPKNHQPPTHDREKFLASRKISSGENNVERKSGFGGEKQLSINFAEKSGKNAKAHKRNNGKNNLNKYISTGESQHYSGEVKKIGRSNNAEANKMNSENCSKRDSGMSVILEKSHTETFPKGDDVPATTGNDFFRQTFEDESSSLQWKANRAAAAPPLFGIKQYDQATFDYNNNSIFPESTTVIPSNEINQRKAPSCEILESRSDSDTQWKWLKEVKTAGVDDAVTAYSAHTQDLNRGTIVFTPTQEQTKKSTSKNFANAAKMLVGTGLNEEVVDSVYHAGVSCRVGEEDQMYDVELKNETSKLVNLKKDFRMKELSMENTNGNSGFVDRRSHMQSVDGNISKKLDSSGKRKLLNFNTAVSLLNQLGPPELPQVGVCNALPNSPEWEEYWEDFDKKLGEYYSRVAKYSKRMDDLLVDDDGYEYTQGLKRRHQEEKALKIRMKLTQPKPPLNKHPLKDTLEIGGYVIRPLGGAVEQANVTTSDHTSFRLEIPCDKMEKALNSITVDRKFNIMTITIPSGIKGNNFMKIIQISVPSYKNVQNLEIGHPLYNGGKIVINGK